MPRGDNPNSRKNLVQYSGRSRKEVERIQKKGGENSGEVRAAQKTLRETVKAKCTQEVLDKITDRVIQMASAGNLNAFKILREMLGEDPRNEIQKELLTLRKKEVELKEEGW